MCEIVIRACAAATGKIFANQAQPQTEPSIVTALFTILAVESRDRSTLMVYALALAAGPRMLRLGGAQYGD